MTQQVIETADAVKEFKNSLSHTLKLADEIKRLGVNPRYNAVLKQLTDYGSVVELVFENPNAMIQEMLYFGRRGGRIGVPVIEEYKEERELDDAEYQ